MVGARTFGVIVWTDTTKFSNMRTDGDRSFNREHRPQLPSVAYLLLGPSVRIQGFKCVWYALQYARLYACVRILLFIDSFG